MSGASETSSLGGRRDRESVDRPWRSQLSGISASPLNGSEFYRDFRHSSDSDDTENAMAEGENVMYGSISISRYNSNSAQFLSHENYPEKGTLRKSALQAFFQNHGGLLPEMFHESDSTDVDNDRMRTRSNVARFIQGRSQMSWSMVVLLSCFCLAFLLVAISLRPTSVAGNEDVSNVLYELFDFDALFGGIKKKPSMASLERPPPLARSILLVLRAEVTPANPIVKDIDRQLTAKGMQEAEGLGIYLQQHDIPPPDWIFASPSERTAFTTELMRRNWGSNAPVAFEKILYTLEFNDYFSFVAGLNDHYRRVMIVGHNPAILNTAKKLMKTHGIEDFPNCGLMEIRWDDLVSWRTIRPYSGSSKMAIDPNNNFFFSSVHLN